MPRKPRLEIEGAIYHIINRGLERKAIFMDDEDRTDFLARLAEALKETNTQILAFALVPNHFHLLVKRNQTNLSALMRKLCAGYAGYFNKKHKRAGYLFQNRYKSILCQKGSYLLQLVRYINLNPLRVGLVKSFDELANYPFVSHSFIMGKRKAHWFDLDLVLVHFAETEPRAKRIYQQFIIDGLSETTDYSGGGLRRSISIEAPAEPTMQAFDDRILGDSDFVQDMLARSDTKVKTNKNLVPEIVSAICVEFPVTEVEIKGKSRIQVVVKARDALAGRLAKQAGLSPAEIAKTIGCTRSAASKMLRRSGV